MHATLYRICFKHDHRLPTAVRKSSAYKGFINWLDAKL